MASNESDEEEDYMSDAFLQGLKDTRPGLVSQTVARQRKQEKKIQLANEKYKTKPRKQIESENRTEGLQKKIGADNKGFAMLQKMGFKPGMTLGKKGTGRAEPVPIEVKAGRSGLGRDVEMKRKQAQISSMRATMMQKRARMMERQQRDYRSRVSSQQVDRQAERDLYKSQKVCEQLDSQKGITEPSERFFWPAALLAKPKKSETTECGGDYVNEVIDDDSDEETEEEEEEEVEFSATEKLEILTMYLRNKHRYCVWCGTTYNDKQDLTDNCPGNTADDHS